MKYEIHNNSVFRFVLNGGNRDKNKVSKQESGIAKN